MVELGPPLMCRLFGHKRAKLAQMNREKGQWESGCKALSRSDGQGRQRARCGMARQSASAFALP
jgi:hypothetical protein